MKLIHFCSNIVLTLFVLLLSSSQVFAGLVDQPTQVPEPSMLSLFAVAAAIAFIVKKRGK